MNWYKLSQSTITAWHISNEKFNKFDPYKSAQGIIWFAKDKNDLTSSLHGASIRSSMPIYLYECQIIFTPHKIAGWDKYDKYGINQLETMGYDTIDLGEDIAVINEKNIKIVKVEKIKSSV